MICPECGSANVRHEVREEQYTYKGQTTSLACERSSGSTKRGRRHVRRRNQCLFAL